MGRTFSGFFWISLYLLVITVPILLMLLPPVPTGRGFWVEFSVALGFVGLTQIAVQFLLIARFKRVTAPYGIDIILHYHRQIAIVAIVLVLLHPIIIMIENPSRVALLNPLGGNWASRSAWVSVLALVGIMVTSLWRQQLGINYEWWRLIHIILGITAVVFAQIHVSLAGLYTNTWGKQLVFITMALVMVGLVVWLRVLRPARQHDFTWRVSEIRRELGDTYALVLKPIDHPGMKFDPGQFAWIKLEGSPWTLKEHPFSFSSSAECREHLEFGIKALGDFTRTVKDIPIGTRAFVDGPHGAFSIDRYPAPGYVFVAGGVGITPMICFLRTMVDRKDPRPVMLIYAANSRAELAYDDEIEAIKKHLDLQVVHVLQQPGHDWQGETGYITAELLERQLPREKFIRFFFVCGPDPMMDAVHTALVEHGVPERHILMERFYLV
jgi:predicted ferric reductase